MRFLVSRTSAFRDRGSWGDDVELLGDEVQSVQARGKGLPCWLRSPWHRWLQFQCGIRLLRLSRGYDAVMVGDNGLWFPVLNHLLGLRKRIVMTGIDWPGVGSGILNRWAALGCSVVCCNTRAEIVRYSKVFRIPPEKFRLVRMAFQCSDVDMWPSGDEGYIFAGGNTDRDWKTFLQAVDGLPYRVRLFSSRAEVRTSLPNVTVASVSRQEYYRSMAAASCVVVPITHGSLSVRGTTTWINAMGMGKVVIVTEPDGAPDYIENGVSGFYVNHGDSTSLRECIVRVMEDAALRKRVGEAAREHAWREFSPEAFRRQVLAFLAERTGGERAEPGNCVGALRTKAD